MQTRFEHGWHRVALFIVNADHLLRVAVLRPADVAFLERGWPVVEGQHQAVVDPLHRQHPPNQVGFGIAANAAGECDLRTQCPQHGCDAGSAAQAMLALIGPQERHGGFLADSIGKAPDVTVEDQVADDHDARDGRAPRAAGSSHASCPGYSLTAETAILLDTVGCTHPTSKETGRP